MGILSRFTGEPRDKFAAQALRVVRRAPGVVAARYDPARFAIAVWRPEDSSPVWLYLSNVYGECAGASRAEREERIERLVRIVSTPRPDETWDSVRTKLRPVLRSVTYGQAGAPGVVPPLSRAALPHLRELVVVDQPDSMSYVGRARLEEWGVSVEEVFAAARANLDMLADDCMRREWPSERALIKMLDAGDGYFTSLLLAPGWLAEVGQRMGGQAIAFVPDTNTVVLCSLPATELPRLYEMVEKEYTDAVRGLSPVGYVADASGRVMPYAPPADHPDHVAARRAEVVLAATEYGAQTRWLSEQYEQAGMEVFVASLLAAQAPGAPAFTVATWADGITSLLPEADYIAFAGIDERAAQMRVPWRAVADLVDLRPEPLLAPVRYRVESWPSPAVMEALRAQAVE